LVFNCGRVVFMRKVLIVDDALFIRLTLKKMLEKYNFQVVGEAGNGIEAIKLYKELKPDIVTMDVTMPEMDGLEAVQMIRNIDGQAKIVMVSAMGQRTMVVKAIESGASGFIVKPFNEAHVVETLNNL